MKMNLRLLVSLALLIGSLVFVQPSIGDGCPGELCSTRTDGSRWCCALKAESNCPCLCIYFNDAMHCRRSTDVQQEESLSD